MRNIPENMPIIFIHFGASFYLPYVLSQIRYSNPDSEIILIGNRAALAQRPKSIIGIPISDFSDTADLFSSLYRQHHRSHSSFNFENNCFRRTFIIEEYLRSRNTNCCWYFDSDNLVYCDLKQQMRNFPEDCRWSAAGTDLLSPHSSYWTLDKLAAFNEHCFRCITPGTEEYSHIDKIWHAYNNSTGGICDMTFLQYFSELYPEHFYHTTETADGCWNNSLNCSFPELKRNRPFMIPQGIKKNGSFFTFHDQKMLTIHCQGFTKRYIPYFYTGGNRHGLFLKTLRFFPRRIAAFIYHEILKM